MSDLSSGRVDLRGTPEWDEIEQIVRATRLPGSGAITGAADPQLSPDGRTVAFAGALLDRLDGALQTKLCAWDRDTGVLRLLTTGDGRESLPRFSPDGTTLAYVSDKAKPGDFQLRLLELAGGHSRPGPAVDGFIEWIGWAPDGRQLLVLVAGHGADVAAATGSAIKTKGEAAAEPWMPEVESGAPAHAWRSLQLIDPVAGTVQAVTQPGINVWEAAWCGASAVVAVVSDAPGETAWYTARLSVLPLAGGAERVVYRPSDQIGLPSAAPDGMRIGIVEAVCSDRTVVAGDLKLFDLAGDATPLPVATGGLDVTAVRWPSAGTILVAGLRGFECAVLRLDTSSFGHEIAWSSDAHSIGARYPEFAADATGGTVAFVAEAFDQPPRLVAIGAQWQAEKPLCGSAAPASAGRHVGAVEQVRWQAPDGLEVQGWLLRPRGFTGPRPLVMDVHGGPVWAWQPFFIGKWPHHARLLADGWAIFFPNPRGSGGRGQDFARRVIGDMGGADTQDYLSGLDHLVATGIADPARICVTGGSYGGFMSAWLVTQDTRFAAAVPVAPVTNWVSQHLTSNIPQFDAMALAARYDEDASGRYVGRSPVMHAAKVRTPVLNIAGALDRCTPPAQAAEFHNALSERGLESALVVYPLEGHGVRRYPAAIDYSVRVVAWLRRHAPALAPR